MTEAERSVPFRPDIEGLRAIAVLLVVACHCGIAQLAGGFIGVDVFFVLSGYLITALLAAEIADRGRIDMARFYARRVRRLLPASALTLLLTLALAALVLAPQELEFAARAARAAALYASNIFFDYDAADYFAPGVELNPLLHTWSLGVEEQFYLFWPGLVLLGLSGGGSRTRLFAILGSLTLASFALCLWMTVRQPTFAFYELPARAWEFGIGGLLALAPLQRLPLPAPAWNFKGWAGLTLILGCGALVPAGAGFPGWRAALPVAGTLVALAAGAQLPRRGVAAVLGAAPLQYLGSRSYSWYLWHWPFVFFAAALVPGVGVPGRILAALAALAAADLTFRLIEQPVRGGTTLRLRPGLSLALAAAVTAVTVGISFLAIRAGQGLAAQPRFAAVNAAIEDISTLPRARCVTPYGADAQVTRCSFGDPGAKVTVALFGDSHAIQWFDAVAKVAQARGWHLVTFLKSGCAAHDAAPLLGGSGCRAWRNQALQEIVALRPQAVFVASYTSAYGLGQSHPEADLERLREGWRRSLEVLAGAGLTVIPFRDTPQPPFDVPTCLARSIAHPWLRGRACDFPESAARDPRTYAAEQAAATGLPGVHFVDLTGPLCPEGSCPARLDGQIVYRDAGHLTGRFAGTLAPQLEARVRDWVEPGAIAPPAR